MILRTASLSPLAAFALLLVMVASCDVSPQPVPPAGPVKDASVAPAPDTKPLVLIAPSLLDLRVVGGVNHVVGRPGAVVPGGAGLDIVNLSRDVVPTTVRVADDGSFDAPAPLDSADTGRLTASASGVRSSPVDVFLDGSGDGLVLLAGGTAFSDCFDLTPAEGIDFGVVGVGAAPVRREIRLVNRCADPVTLGEVALRPAAPGFAIDPGAPAVVAAATSATITVSFNPSAAGESHSNLSLRLQAPSLPAPGVRALSLSAQAR